MKKYVLVMIVLLLVTSAVGCAESNSKDTNVSSEGASNSGQDNIQQPAQTTTETSSSYNDAVWLNVIASDTSSTGSLVTDMNNIGYACAHIDTVGMAQTGIYAENLYQSTNTALQNSNLYNVSPELQSAKDEYNLGLASINTAAMLIAGSVDAYNKGDSDTCISLMKSAKTSTDTGNQHLTTAASLIREYNKNHSVK